MSYGMPPPAPGYGAPYGGAPPPSHPQAVTVLVLGILALTVCQVLGVVAWVMGNRVLGEIDASAGALGGQSTAQAGRICGIVATVLTLIGLALLAGLLSIFVIGGAAVSTRG